MMTCMASKRQRRPSFWRPGDPPTVPASPTRPKHWPAAGNPAGKRHLTFAVPQMWVWACECLHDPEVPIGAIIGSAISQGLARRGYAGHQVYETRVLRPMPPLDGAVKLPESLQANPEKSRTILSSSRVPNALVWDAEAALAADHFGDVNLSTAYRVMIDEYLVGHGIEWHREYEIEPRRPVKSRADN